MDLRGRLGIYEMIAIGLVIIGALFLLGNTIISYYAFGLMHGDPETVRDLSKLTNLIVQIGALIIGFGFFLSFRRLYQKTELPRVFSIINYIYLILLLPQFYYIYFFLFDKSLVNPSPLISNLYHIGFNLLPGIRNILFAIMFVFVFIVIVKRERSKEPQPTQEQPPEEQMESDL